MRDTIDLPPLEAYLPEMMGFVSRLAQDYQVGELETWEVMDLRVRAFFTPERLEAVEAVVPGWRKMASCGEGITLVHVMVVFTALLLLPEFQQASPVQREIMKWAVLFHDISKEVRQGYRDLTHGFRSAAVAGATLPKLGFPVTPEYVCRIEAWSALVRGAVKLGEKSDYIQDNGRLPEIIEGLEQLFGSKTPATLIVKTVLFHMSITVLQAWPQAAPLTPAEVRRYLGAELLPLLKMMMLADNDGWVLFEQPTQVEYRQETLKMFEALVCLSE